MGLARGGNPRSVLVREAWRDRLAPKSQIIPYLFLSVQCYSYRGEGGQASLATRGTPLLLFP